MKLLITIIFSLRTYVVVHRSGEIENVYKEVLQYISFFSFEVIVISDVN